MELGSMWMRIKYNDTNLKINEILKPDRIRNSDKCISIWRRGNIIIGKYYDSKKRAKEIMDEIYNFQEDIVKLELDLISKEDFISKHKTMIYELPIN